MRRQFDEFMEFSEEIAERGSVDVLEWWNSKKQIWGDLSTVALASVTCPAHLEELDLQAFDSDKETVLVNFCRANWKHVSRHNFSVSEEMLRIKRETGEEEDEEEEDEEMETSQSFSSDSEPERTGLTPEGPRMSTPIHSPSSSSSSSLQLAPKRRRTGVISDSSDQTSTASAATNLAATATVAGSAAAATVVRGSADLNSVFREMRANVQADIAQRQAEGAGPSTASATTPATAPPASTSPSTALATAPATATTGLATASAGPSTASATAPATATTPPATAGLSTASTASSPVISGSSTAATPGPSAAASGPVTRAKTKTATLPTTLTVATGLITVSPTTADLPLTTVDTTTASPTTTSATVMADIAASAVPGPSAAATATSVPTLAVPDSTTDMPTRGLRCVPLSQLVDLVDDRLPTTGAASSLFTRTDRPEPELIDLTYEDITSPWESIESNREEGELSDTD